MFILGHLSQSTESQELIIANAAVPYAMRSDSRSAEGFQSAD